MDNIIDITENQPHEVYEAMCAKCLSRWVAVVPVDVPLINIECKECGTGFVIKTGQPINTGEEPK